MASKISAGQVALTGSAQQLTGLKGFSAETAILRNRSATNTMYLGNSSAVSPTTGFPIAPGEALSMDILNPGSLWVIGTAADLLAWLVLSP